MDVVPEDMEFNEIAEDQSVESHQLMDVDTSAPKDLLKCIIPKNIFVSLQASA